nr:TldD/PmbA family protein [Methanobacterium alcaliphilum]
MMDVALQALKYTEKYTDLAEIFVEKEQVLQLDIQNDKLDFAKEESTSGVGIRVILDGKMGFSYTSNPEEIKNTVERAISNSKANEKDENFTLSQPTKYKDIKGTYDEGINSLEVETALEFAQTMINTVKDAKCQPTSGGFSAVLSKMLILNSNGVSCQDKSTGFAGYLAVNAEKGDEKSTAYDSESSCFLNIDPEKLASKVCKLATDSIGGKPVETKDMDIIVDHHAGAGLLGTFINALNADNVLRGRSILADKVGEEVVSSNLSIYDNGTLEHGLNSSRCDGEGTASEKTSLIENGVLKGFIFDLYNASKAGAKSTGNGIRPSFAETPTISVTNVMVDYGTKTDLSELDDVILVTDVLGAHTANPISGDFSVEANNAFVVKNGEISHPVKKAMLSGNIFEALKKSEAMDSEIKQYGPFVMPQILLHDLRVVGQ